MYVYIYIYIHTFKSPFARHLLLSALVLSLEGLCIGYPELAAPSPKIKCRDRLGCGTYADGRYVLSLPIQPH